MSDVVRAIQVDLRSCYRDIVRRNIGHVRLCCRHNLKVRKRGGRADVRNQNDIASTRSQGQALAVSGITIYRICDNNSAAARTGIDGRIIRHRNRVVKDHVARRRGDIRTKADSSDPCKIHRATGINIAIDIQRCDFSIESDTAVGVNPADGQIRGGLGDVHRTDGGVAADGVIRIARPIIKQGHVEGVSHVDHGRGYTQCLTATDVASRGHGQGVDIGQTDSGYKCLVINRCRKQRNIDAVENSVIRANGLTAVVQLKLSGDRGQHGQLIVVETDLASCTAGSITKAEVASLAEHQIKHSRHHDGAGRIEVKISGGQGEIIAAVNQRGST